jgi:NTE family protein
MPPERVLEKHPKVALVLGGGAFHGTAHFGIIKVFEEEGIPIDLIVGTSAGALVGALYADNPNIDSLLPLVNGIKRKDLFDFSPFRKKGYVSGKRLQKFLNENVTTRNIEETTIPFVAVTTDMKKGESVALSAGPIPPSINASCAIPYVFVPVKMYGTLYSDGGVMNNVPTDVAEAYDPKMIIAVDVMATWDTVTEFKNKREVLIRAYAVAGHRMKKGNLKYADIVIAPNLADMPYLDADENEMIYQRGIEAAREAMPRIRELMEEKGIERNF